MSLIASTSEILKLHTWPNGILYQNYHPMKFVDSIKSISWSPDGRTLILVPNSGTAELLQMTKRQIELFKTVDSISNATCVAFPNKCGKVAALGTSSGVLKVYSVERGDVFNLPKLPSEVSGIAYNNIDTHIAASSRGGIYIFDSARAELKSFFKISRSTSGVPMNFHRLNENLLIVGDDDGILTIFDLNTNKKQWTWRRNETPITYAMFSPIHTSLAVSSAMDHKCSIYDFESNAIVHDLHFSSFVTTFDFSECGIYLALGRENGQISLYDTRNLAKELKLFLAHHGNRINNLYFQKDQNVIESAEETSTINCKRERPSLDEEVNKNKHTSRAGFSKIPSPKKFKESPNVTYKTALQNSALKTSRELLGSSATPKLPPIDGSGNFNSTLPDVLESTKAEELHGILKNNRSVPEKVPVSTPKSATSNLPNFACSPVSVGSLTLSPFLHNVKMQLGEVVKDEVDRILASSKEELRTEFNETMRRMRLQFLGIDMLVMRNFMNVENAIEKKVAHHHESIDYDRRLELQNEALMKELVDLKERIFNDYLKIQQTIERAILNHSCLGILQNK